MKTIGLLGGMSWESTASYYRLINQGVNERLGGLHSAQIVMVSVDFETIARQQRAGDWTAAAEALGRAASLIQAAGADGLVICTNTMHKIASQIEAAVDIPLLHIADATATALQREGIRTAGLLGTRFTMEQDFYVGRLRERFGIDVVIPGPEERETVHRVIFEELCQGRIETASRLRYLEIIEALARQGAEAVILGCTEIGLLVSSSDTPVRLLDTTAVHAARAVDWALASD
jgi:aspartate racemase